MSLANVMRARVVWLCQRLAELEDPDVPDERKDRVIRRLFEIEFAARGHQLRKGEPSNAAIIDSLHQAITFGSCLLPRRIGSGDAEHAQVAFRLALKRFGETDPSLVARLDGKLLADAIDARRRGSSLAYREALRYVAMPLGAFASPEAIEQAIRRSESRR